MTFRGLIHHPSAKLVSLKTDLAWSLDEGMKVNGTNLTLYFPVTCPELGTLDNGEIKCTDDNIYGSICKFRCNEGFFMIGEKVATCETDFKWSSPVPVCQACKQYSEMTY